MSFFAKNDASSLIVPAGLLTTIVGMVVGLALLSGKLQRDAVKKELTATVAQDVIKALQAGKTLKPGDVFVESHDFKGDQNQNFIGGVDKIYARASVTQTPTANSSGKVFIETSDNELKATGLLAPERGAFYNYSPASQLLVPAAGQ